MRIPLFANSGCVTHIRKYQENLAESAVRHVKGIKGITNNIEIKPKASATEVKTRIGDALRRSAELDARRITVELDGNTVQLHGSVSSWSERNNAERAAWSAPGTFRVENHISVIP